MVIKRGELMKVADTKPDDPGADTKPDDPGADTKPD